MSVQVHLDSARPRVPNFDDVAFLELFLAAVVVGGGNPGGNLSLWRFSETHDVVLGLISGTGSTTADQHALSKALRNGRNALIPWSSASKPQSGKPLEMLRDMVNTNGET